MKILTEKDFDNSYVGKVILENGIHLYVNIKGFAEGSDGKRYVGVFREDTHDDLIPIGWTTDAEKTVIIE